MLTTHYKSLKPESKKFAIHRIATRIDTPEHIVKKVLENRNPLMDIRDNRVVVNRNSYNKLLKEIHKEFTAI
ncbi:hypothetical protein GCM10022393_17140 [Aquimarina addita]|uniref:Uncharacterized protein n=1 Tax=Aquimarina addita TaxID=870485 RepID=A0ABP7XHL8_9FLAO